jgi:hypothetical protein
MIKEELDREREERNYFQLERDRISIFCEITKRQLEGKFEFLCKCLYFLIKQAQYAWIIKMSGFFMFYSLTRLGITNCQMLNDDSQ